jgi:hypothetical protein
MSTTVYTIGLHTDRSTDGHSTRPTPSAVAAASAHSHVEAPTTIERLATHYHLGEEGAPLSLARRMDSASAGAPSAKVSESAGTSSGPCRRRRRRVLRHYPYGRDAVVAAPRSGQ